MTRNHIDIYYTREIQSIGSKKYLPKGGKTFSTASRWFTLLIKSIAMTEKIAVGTKT